MGATGRLGVAIAHGIAARGGKVVLSGRDEQKLAALAASIGEAHGETPPFVCADLTQRDAPDRVLAGVRATAGRIDDLVLACGPFPRTPFPTVQREEFERTLTVHAVAPLLLVQLLAPDLTASGGAVVALGDADTTRPSPDHVG